MNLTYHNWTSKQNVERFYTISCNSHLSHKRLLHLRAELNISATLMDLNNILSLLKGQNIVTPSTNTAPSIPLPSNSGTLDISNLDLSSINPNVIAQVRNEYLNSKNDTTEAAAAAAAAAATTQQEEDKVKNATTITPEVLVAIGTMVKETNLIQTLKNCKARQDKKERELYSHRESVKERYKKQKDSLLAKELIGVKVSPEELRVKKLQY